MKTSIISDNCLIIQKDIILGDDLSKARKNALKDHLQICPECRAFAGLQAGLKQSLAAERHRWRPRATTLEHLQQRMARKQGGRTRPSVHWLEQVLGYRIPLYHALVAVIFVGCVYLGAVHLYSLLTVKSSPTDGHAVEETVIETDQATQILEAMREQKIGRTINEDSLYSRFTFTI